MDRLLGRPLLLFLGKKSGHIPGPSVSGQPNSLGHHHAACYLFNSAGEEEGSSVLRDHAHFLAGSPTVCPSHPEIENYDCLKRGKWRWSHSSSSFSGPGGRDAGSLWLV